MYRFTLALLFSVGLAGAMTVSIPATAENIDQSTIELLKTYRDALGTKDPDIIRRAYEAVKKNSSAVSYMREKLPNLYANYQQRQVLDSMNQMHREQAARGEITKMEDIAGEKFNQKPRPKPSTKSVSGDPALADLAEPGVKHTPKAQGQRTSSLGDPTSDPDLGKLAKGQGQKLPKGHPSQRLPTNVSSGPNTQFAKGDQTGAGAQQGATNRVPPDQATKIDPGKRGATGQAQTGGDKPSIQEIMNRGKGALTPEQAGVEFKPRPQPTTKGVTGDTGLADLAEPGVKHVPKNTGRTSSLGDPTFNDPDLGKLGKGTHPSRFDTPTKAGGVAPAETGSNKVTKIDTGSNKATKIDALKGKGSAVSSGGAEGKPSIQEIMNRGKGALTPEQAGVEFKPRPQPTTKGVTGDTGLADLAEPGVKHVPKNTGRTSSLGDPTFKDPDLAKLGKGTQPSRYDVPTKAGGKVPAVEGAKATPQGEPAKTTPRGQTTPKGQAAPKGQTAAGAKPGSNRVAAAKSAAAKGVNAMANVAIVADALQREREEAAAEGRDFDPKRAIANLYDSVESTAIQSRDKSAELTRGVIEIADKYGVPRAVAWSTALAAVPVTTIGAVAADHSRSVIREEIEKEMARVQKEGGPGNYGVMKSDVSAEDVKKAVTEFDATHVMGAKGKAASRMAGEMTGYNKILDTIMYDSDAAKAAGKSTQALTEKAKDKMQQELIENAKLERRMDQLNNNYDPSDPKVQEELSRLQEEYNRRREDLQAVNERLKGKLDEDDPALAWIRQQVESMPERSAPIPEQRSDMDLGLDHGSEQGLDDQMIALGDTDSEKAAWEDEGYRETFGPDADRFADDFAGDVDDLQNLYNDGDRIRLPDAAEEAEDYGERIKAERDERESADDRLTIAKRQEDERYEQGWRDTIADVNEQARRQDEEALRELEQKIAEGLERSRQADIERRERGDMSEAEFQERMSRLKEAHRRSKENFAEVMDRIARNQDKSGSMIASTDDGQVAVISGGGCDINFHYDGKGRFDCMCPGYTFSAAMVRCVRVNAPQNTLGEDGSSGGESDRMVISDTFGGGTNDGRVTDDARQSGSQVSRSSGGEGQGEFPVSPGSRGSDAGSQLGDGNTGQAASSTGNRGSRSNTSSRSSSSGPMDCTPTFLGIPATKENGLGDFASSPCDEKGNLR